MIKMTEEKSNWERFMTWISRPIRLPWIPEETYRRDLEDWKERHHLIEKPKVTINVTKNIYGAKIKDKKTGKIIELNEDEYEIVRE